MIALFPTAIAVSFLPGSLGEELPPLVFIGGSFLVLADLPLEREALKRHGTDYPSDLSLNLRAAFALIVSIGCFALAYAAVQANDSETAFNVAIVGAIFLVLAWMKWESTKKKLDYGERTRKSRQRRPRA
jgi:hypothetical protein